ncbi:MAG: helix-turn-helix transcriptional regulator [Pseudomonadota bacterium]
MPITTKHTLTARQTRAFLKEAALTTTRAPAFAFRDSFVGRRYAPHTHPRHQLLYAVSGSVTLEVAEATYLLPPQRVALIPAGVKHLTNMGKARTISLFFDRRLLRVGSAAVHVLEVTPLLREMIQYATRWPPSRRARDALADAFFRSLALLLEDWLKAPSSYRLPRGRSKLVRAAIAFTLEHAGALPLATVCRAVGASERTLRRHLLAETGLGFRELLGQARILRAMELLASGEVSVTDAALAVGFDSPSAFAKSFARVAGQSPRGFRERVRPRSISA